MYITYYIYSMYMILYYIRLWRLFSIVPDYTAKQILSYIYAPFKAHLKREGASKVEGHSAISQRLDNSGKPSDNV